jgi:sugar fermentation stimulation protein A
VFLARPNRFVVVAERDGARVVLASRDPGRLTELLVPGARLLAAPASDPARRTAYTLALVRHGGGWVSVVPALANTIFASALARGGVPGLRGARILAREVVRGASRFDFVLRHRGADVLTEVKSVTLVAGGRALFPDAPTERGARHLRHLAEHARGGARALLVFVVQRPDADGVAPFRARDPVFAAALDAAVAAGVRVLAYTCRVSRAGLGLYKRIPLRRAE